MPSKSKIAIFAAVTIAMVAASPVVYHILVWENSDPLDIHLLELQKETDGHRVALIEVLNKSWFPVLIWRGKLEGTVQDAAGNDRVLFSSYYSSNLAYEDNSPRLFAAGTSFITKWHLEDDIPSTKSCDVWMNYVWMPANQRKMVETDWWIKKRLPAWLAHRLPSFNEQTRDSRTNTLQMVWEDAVPAPVTP